MRGGSGKRGKAALATDTTEAAAAYDAEGKTGPGKARAGGAKQLHWRLGGHRSPRGESGAHPAGSKL